MLFRLEKILFYLFIFIIPFQIREFIFWSGNEWNSVFLYLGDVLFGLVLVLWFLRIKQKKSKFLKKSDFLILVFLLIAIISLFTASNSEIAIFRFIKLLEFVLLFFYVKNAIPIYKSHPNDTNKIYKILIASGVFQSVLAIVQFINQKSLGLKFIEAGVFDPNMSGVANFIYNGERIMRAYGSFSHPNVLAAFLLLAIFCFYALHLRFQSTNRIRMIQIILFFLLIFGLFLTFSRTALLVFLFISLAFFLIKFFQIRPLLHTEQRILLGKKLIKLSSLFLISCILCLAILWPFLKARFFSLSLEEQAIDLRFFYNKMAFAMIKEKPLFGVGIGGFVWHSQNYEVFLQAASKVAGSEESPLTVKGSVDDKIPDWLFQPVHNIYLLIGVEMGIIGLVVFLLFIISLLWRRLSLLGEAQPLTFLVIAFLIIALTDHYFWTLHSGGIMFWLSLALAKSNS